MSVVVQALEACRGVEIGEWKICSFILVQMLVFQGARLGYK
jgi:hypothetical protein